MAASLGAPGTPYDCCFSPRSVLWRWQNSPSLDYVQVKNICTATFF